MYNPDFKIKLNLYLGHDADVCIPDNVTHIDRGAFRGCQTLKSVVIPEGVREIGEEAFACCHSLEDVTLPASLEVWPWNIFEDCPALTLFHVPVDSWVRQIPDILGVPAVDMEGKPLPPVPVKETDWYFEEDDGEIIITGRSSPVAGTLYPNEDGATTLYIPAVLRGLPVRRIAKFAFEGDDGIDALYLPDGLITIGKGAFADCFSLERIRVPDSLEYIYPGAFYECYPDQDSRERLQCIDGYCTDVDPHMEDQSSPLQSFSQAVCELLGQDAKEISSLDLPYLYDAAQNKQELLAMKVLIGYAPKDVGARIRWARDMAQEILKLV